MTDKTKKAFNNAIAIEVKRMNISDSFYDDLVEYLYDMNVRADIKIESLAQDICLMVEEDTNADMG